MASSHSSSGDVRDTRDQQGSHPPPTSNTAAGNSQEVIAFSTIVLNYVLPQVVKDLEAQDVGPAQAFADSLRKAEAEVPGIAFQIVSSILESQSPKLNVIEHLLKLTGSSAGPDSYLESQGGYYAELEQHAHEVKKILSSLPEIVLDRSRFLDNIKKIALHLKNYLAALVHIAKELEQKYPQNTAIQRSLQYRRQEFSRASRHFSEQLKVYFQDNSKAQNIYPSALALIASNIQFSHKLKDMLLQLNGVNASRATSRGRDG
ncbi:programmed cell death protein 10-A-like [Convolutriloba macropyga]|uniref:programmed cell death protein 10-A-like n=1 Tax=Convolutriloba macropyga TaxID=536237 RepID=UPI003F52757D